MASRQLTAVFAIALLLLIGCSLPVYLSSTIAPTTPSELKTPSTLTAISSPQATPSETAEAPFTGSCGWAWANQDLTELTDELSQVFRDAGMQDIEIRASAYGENCFDPQTNKVIRFAAMQTDFYLTIPVNETGDAQVLGDWIARVIKALRPFLPGRVPGPNPGSIGIRFISPAGEENLWFSRSSAESLLDSGKTGSVLYEALR